MHCISRDRLDAWVADALIFPYKVLQGPCDSNFLRAAGYFFLSTISQHNEPSCDDTIQLYLNATDMTTQSREE